jgi:hypothetical protein
MMCQGGVGDRGRLGSAGRGERDRRVEIGLGARARKSGSGSGSGSEVATRFASRSFEVVSALADLKQPRCRERAGFDPDWTESSELDGVQGGPKIGMGSGSSLDPVAVAAAIRRRGRDSNPR